METPIVYGFINEKGEKIQTPEEKQLQEDFDAKWKQVIIPY